MLVIEAFISALKIHPEVVSIVDFELLARFRHLKSIPKENTLFLSASFISLFEVDVSRVYLIDFLPVPGSHIMVF